MAKTQCKILLWFFGIALLVFQVYADKEPHEDSKEDNSVINKFFFNSKDVTPSSVFQIENGKNSKEIKGTEAPMNDLGFAHAFVASLSVIIVSELGDKTFFIAAIMAMRHSRLVVFSGAILALVIMTCISGINFCCEQERDYNLLFIFLCQISSFWVGDCNYSKSLYILDINCIICCIWA